jgi:hypothetical protein
MKHGINNTSNYRIWKAKTDKQGHRKPCVICIRKILENILKQSNLNDKFKVIT